MSIPTVVAAVLIASAPQVPETPTFEVTSSKAPASAAPVEHVQPARATEAEPEAEAPPAPASMPAPTSACGDEIDCAALRLQREGTRRRRQGGVLLTLGVLELAAGASLVGVGIHRKNKANENWELWLMQTGSTNRYHHEKTKAKAMEIGGGVLLMLGLAATITGGAFIGAGNSKIRRAADARNLRPTVSFNLRGGATLGVKARF